MALPPVKALIVERDGADLADPEEYDLDASNLPFNRVGFSSYNIEDAINEAATGDTGIDAVSWDVTYTSGRPNVVTVYDSNTQVTANRVQDYTYTYTGHEPTTVVQKSYEADGTTVSETVTYTLTWTGNKLDKVTSVTT